MSTRPTPDASAHNAGPATERAAAALGVPADAPPATVRAAFLRRLPSAGLVPPPEWRSAVRVLTGQLERSPTALADSFSDVSADAPLRAEVEAFAESFWSYAPAERRQCWQTLIDRCTTDRPLATRLRRLEAGVDLESVSRAADPSRSEELAVMVQELFVLKPAAAAARRREQITALRAPASAWADAARQLLEYQPALAALEPALIERLTAPPSSTTGWAATATEPAWSFRVQGGLQVPRAPSAARRMAGSSSSARWLVLVVVISVIGSLLRAGMSSRNGHVRLPEDTSSATPLQPPWRTSNAPPHIGNTTIDDPMRARQRSLFDDSSRRTPNLPERTNEPPRIVPLSRPGTTPASTTPTRPGGGRP